LQQKSAPEERMCGTTELQWSAYWRIAGRDVLAPSLNGFFDPKADIEIDICWAEGQRTCPNCRPSCQAEISFLEPMEVLLRRRNDRRRVIIYCGKGGAHIRRQRSRGLDYPTALVPSWGGDRRWACCEGASPIRPWRERNWRRRRHAPVTSAIWAGRN